jgi:predicted permease
MRWLSRFLRTFRQGADDRAIRAELDLHVELEAKELEEQGLSRAEARRRALLAFGGLEKARTESREARRLPWLEALRLDVRQAVRSLRRTPGFTLIAVITLAVGVGANASMLAFVDALMFRPPAGVEAPARLATVTTASNYVHFLDLAERAQTLTLAAFTRNSLSLGVGDDAAPLRVECATASYFSVLGTRLVIGRAFSGDGNAELSAPGIILAHGLWLRRFNGDPAALGTTVTVAGRPYTVVGVAPPGFTGILPEVVDAWLLLPVSPESCSFTGRNLLGSASGSWLTTVARLREGTSLAQAAAEVSSLESPEQRALRAQSRTVVRDLVPIYESRQARVARDADVAVWLVGAAAVVLLIACANVAGLLSIRVLDRRRETAVRLQLGASRSHIVRQYLVEYLVLAWLCGGAALVVAAGVNGVLATFFPYSVVTESFDVRVLAVAGGLALVAAIASGLVPALQASQTDSAVLARSSVYAERERSPFQAVVVVVQVALAFVLVAGTGLFIRSLQQTRLNLGFDPDGLFVATVDLRQSAGYRNSRDIPPVFEAMAGGLRSLPLVESVSLSSGSFLGAGGATAVRPLGKPGGQPVSMYTTAVSPSYFETLGTRILRGRAFTSEDGTGGRRVAIIDEEVARHEWPNEDVIGKCGFGSGPAGNCAEIVGLVESRREGVGTVRYSPHGFVPLAQANSEDVPQLLLIRSRRGEQAAISSALQGAVPNMPHVNVRSFDDMADAQTRSWRLGRTLFGMFGFVAILLASLGLYGVLALAARQRTTEIGLRMALGARPIEVARLVLRQAATLIAAGWVVGVVLALIGARYIGALLFQVAPTDVVTFAGASLVMVLSGLAGCVLPALRAASVAPIVALRNE